MRSGCLAILLLGLSCISLSHAARLEVSGTDLMYDGKKVFLNGVNFAWNHYGEDFGNGKYDGSLEQWLKEISEAGGNSIRVWIHVEGYSTPEFDNDGFVLSCDNGGTFINDMKTFLDAAQENNILVVLALWNGAYLTNQKAVDLVWDDSKLDTYLEKCLRPLAKAVSGHPALGAWEAVNEPEGSVKKASDGNKCYDTTNIGNSGAGWTGKAIPMENYLHFIGRINSVVKEADPTGLRTLGSWGHFAQSDAFDNTVNHYSDDCLNGAASGGDPTIDFNQMHSYDWGSNWAPNAPFTVDASDYQLDKPIVIGEFASVCALDNSLNDLYEYAYSHGYSGAWSWHWVATGECSDSRDDQRNVLGYLKGRTEHGDIEINVH